MASLMISFLTANWYRYQRDLKDKPSWNIKYIFGHSTGHAGSTSVSHAFHSASCSWNIVKCSKGVLRRECFENSSPNERIWPYDPKCELVKSKLIPYLESFRRDGQIYVDMGHYHNQGRTIECIASILGKEAIFVHIRRNRYDIANSFLGKGMITPCLNTGEKHPEVSICPFSGEDEGPVDLPVSDQVWLQMTPFQKFLWYADEIEHRWHILKTQYDSTFFEITWSFQSEFQDSLNQVLSEMACETVSLENRKKHIKHTARNRNCSQEILQDFKYREMMKYNAQSVSILLPYPKKNDI